MRIRGEFTQAPTALFRPQIQDDTLLVAVEAREVAVTDLPRDLAAWRLDLDHLGTEIGQQHGRVRARQHDADLENPDAGQRSGVAHRTALASSAITSRVRYFEAISSSRLSPIGSRRTDRSVTPASAN